MIEEDLGPFGELRVQRGGHELDVAGRGVARRFGAEVRPRRDGVLGGVREDERLGAVARLIHDAARRAGRPLRAQERRGKYRGGAGVVAEHLRSPERPARRAEREGAVLRVPKAVVRASAIGRSRDGPVGVHQRHACLGDLGRREDILMVRDVTHDTLPVRGGDVNRGDGVESPFARAGGERGDRNRSGLRPVRRDADPHELTHARAIVRTPRGDEGRAVEGDVAAVRAVHPRRIEGDGRDDLRPRGVDHFDEVDVGARRGPLLIKNADGAVVSDRRARVEYVVRRADDRDLAAEPISGAVDLLEIAVSVSRAAIGCWSTRCTCRRRGGRA